MDLFKVISSWDLGRHLVAAQNIKQGQLVLQQEPYAAVLYDEAVPMRCDYCMRPAAPGQSLLRCSRSKHARYCNRAHQLAAWEAGYKHECQALLATANKVPPPTVRLAARALQRHLRSQKQQQQEAEHCSWQAVQELLPHWGSLSDEKKSMYAQMAVIARDFAAKATAAPAAAAAAAGTPAAEEQLPSVREVALLLARFACNNHTICDEELRPVGVGLYPLGALLNHSCTPNCMQGFGPRGRIEFRALVDIPKGQPLTISYVELAATRQERREELAGTYYFDIDAPRPPPSQPLKQQQQQQQQQQRDKQQQQQGQEQEQQGEVGRHPGSNRQLTMVHASSSIYDASYPGAETGALSPGAIDDIDIGNDGSSVSCAALSPAQEGPAEVTAVFLPPEYSKGLRPTAAAEVGFELDASDLGLQPVTDSSETVAAVAAAGTTAKRAVAMEVDHNAGAQLPCRLRVYWGKGLSQELAPWPCDERDALLTQLLVLLPGQAAAAAAAAAVPGGQVASLTGVAARQVGALQELALPGGLQVHMVRVQQEQQGLGQLDMEESEEEEDDMGYAACPSASQHGIRVAATEALNIAEVECWGNWATEAIESAMQRLDKSKQAGAGGDSSSCMNMAAASVSQNQSAAPGQRIELSALARRMAAAAHMQAAAGKLAQQGNHGDAVQLLLRALRQVEPGSSSSSGAAAGAGPAAAGAAGAVEPGLVPGLGPFHIMRMRILAALLKAAIDEGSNYWTEALTAARSLLPIYQLVYPPVWPNLGLHHATLAKLELLVGLPANALQHARAAVSMLELTHGGVRSGGGLGADGPGVIEQLEEALREAEAGVREAGVKAL